VKEITITKIAIFRKKEIGRLVTTDCYTIRKNRHQYDVCFLCTWI